MFLERTRLGCEIEARNPSPIDDGSCGNPVVARWDFQDGTHIYVCEECDELVCNSMEKEYEQAFYFNKLWKLVWGGIW